MAFKELWHTIVGSHEPVSKEFEHMLMRDGVRTELSRIRAEAEATLGNPGKR